MEQSLLIIGFFSLIFGLFFLFLSRIKQGRGLLSISSLYASMFLLIATISLGGFFYFFGANAMLPTLIKDQKVFYQLVGWEKVVSAEEETEFIFIPEDLILPKSILIDAPLISQLPELPRGCEVTSLAMLLQWAGKDVDKMKLADKIYKDKTPLEHKDGRIYYGHPNSGFIGNMYTRNEPGLGVYHRPIKELAEQYLPKQILDFTGQEFDKVLYMLAQEKPVWVIINTRYTELPESEFVTWITPKGEIAITYRMHSVLVTGYDEHYIYFNDPLTNVKNRKALKSEFIAAWEQMGRQAIAIKDK